MFVGEQMLSAVSRSVWNLVISSRDIAEGSARSRLAVSDAFAIAVWCELAAMLALALSLGLRCSRSFRSLRWRRGLWVYVSRWEGKGEVN